VLHVDVQEPSVTKLPQFHVKVAPLVGAVQAFALQVAEPAVKDLSALHSLSSDPPARE
jgi:hypothetical protein